MSMGFGDLFKEVIPEYRVRYNIGAMFDIYSSDPIKGKWGNTLLNGGLWYTTGVVGPNNSFKSTVSKHLLLSVMNNYFMSTGLSLDTEISGAGVERYQSLASHFSKLSQYDFNSLERWRIFSNVEVKGDVFWKYLKSYGQMKTSKENVKNNTLTTPMVDSKGNYTKALIPTPFEIDSLSQLAITEVDNKYENVSAGHKDRNMEYMGGGRAKSQIMRDMPTTNNHYALQAIMTAHVGQQYDLDPYKPAQKKFQEMKAGKTVKYIPESFSFNTAYLFEIESAVALINQNTKGPEFPRVPGEEYAGNRDLVELQINILRGKTGGTGFKFPLLCSQTDGVLPYLSCYWYLRKNKYGVNSDNGGRTWYCELLPEVSFGRTTTRETIDNNHRLQRALQLTADLHMMQAAPGIAGKFPPELVCTPKELYEDIKTLGYDWEELLDTIGEWCFREEQQLKPTLTIHDLLNMRAGLYKPYWHQEEWKKSKPKGMEP